MEFLTYAKDTIEEFHIHEVDDFCVKAVVAFANYILKDSGLKDKGMQYYYLSQT